VLDHALKFILFQLEESRDKVVLTEYADIASYNGNFYAQPEMQATENEQTPKRSENKVSNISHNSQASCLKVVPRAKRVPWPVLQFLQSVSISLTVKGRPLQFC
jgi:hypothetical protein